MRKLALALFTAAAPLAIVAAPAGAVPPNAIDPCQLGYPADNTVRDAQGHLVPPLPCPAGVWTWGPRSDVR
jgi:hypothetical protein